MSGILDNKSRVIDALLTYEGRRQMADGNFVIKYATFSDAFVYYQQDLEEGHVDPTNKIYLEAFNAPHDQIIFEADDSGNLIPFRQHAEIGTTTIVGSTTGSVAWKSFSQGKLKEITKTYSYTTAVTSSIDESTIRNDDFASQIEGILTSSFDNFKKLRIIGSQDRVFADQEFALNTNEVSFNIVVNEETVQMQDPTNINTIDALFNDEKLRNIDNFKYLPPIKKVKNNNSIDKTDVQALETENYVLGFYPPWGPTEKLTFSDIKKELNQYEATAKTIYFDPTSRDNEIVSQFFEINQDTVSKLDVIDYGRVSDNFNNPRAATHHVFFAGKVLIDDAGSTNFIHLFTLVFEIDEENNASIY